MSVKERILAIRLLNLIREKPEYAKALGLTGSIAEFHRKKNNLLR